MAKSCLQAGNILKSSGMKYAKPCQRDYRRLENAELHYRINSKKESVREFLEKIREKNPEKTIVIILDNFRSHRGQERQEEKQES